MEPLKEMFNRRYYERLADLVTSEYPNFDKDRFLKQVCDGMEALSLNQRLRRTSETLAVFLPQDFRKAVATLKKVIRHTTPGYTNLVFPDFVGLYGQEDFETSMEALKFFTSFGSSEFAIREFIKRNTEQSLAVMKTWAKDPNHHVRRLASEGSRPRLPWSFKLDRVIKDPGLTLPILELLNKDPELYVRKSVANHLNDISKDHPDEMLRAVKSWDKQHPHTAWIIKHASRTLIKKGHSASLLVFDFEKNPKLRIEALTLTPKRLKLGENLQFSFEIVSEKKTAQKLVVDYVIHYRKKSGELSAKVFKLKELNLAGGARESVSKQQRFQDFTTRKHFKGEHLLEIQVNGKRLAQASFFLQI